MYKQRYSPALRSIYFKRALTHGREYFSLPYDDSRLVSRHKPTGKLKTLTLNVKYPAYPALSSWD